MGKVTGFIEYDRQEIGKRPVEERVQDFLEVYQPLPMEAVKTQAARCMDCGVPFCHTGCPVNNIIPDWNDLVYRDRWDEAIRMLHATNNFPEFTGRICPAPCETSCVLGITSPPVSIKVVERTIIEEAWARGYVKPEPPAQRSGKKVAIIGSGPAGLAAAQQLNRAGHLVTVFEKNAKPGGLLRYGIPDFKLEKWVIDRRLEQLEAEGVKFRTNVSVGAEITGDWLRSEFDAILLAMGSEQPRDLPVPGRELKGIHFAMEFLPQQNRRVSREETGYNEGEITAAGKHVIIIGGGDTGADCFGTSRRQGAASITQLELFPKPPVERAPQTPWPLWPMRLRTETSHEEGGQRLWSINTTRFEGDADGNVKALHAVRVGAPPKFEVEPGSESVLPADLVLLAMGFTGPRPGGIADQLGYQLDARGNAKANDEYMTSVPGVFAAGDVRRGQSLVVWAIAEGRNAAHGVDQYLTGASSLPLTYKQ
ncbi:MAG: glutamate synthase subunit beta [Bryobacterales bacterium]|nr:glutamate synthase subunit beta [Bryobacterales bacterium]